MPYKEYNSELQLFVPISAFFDNQPRRPRQRKKFMYQPVGAGCQRRGIWEEKNVILHYTLYNPLSYHSQMSKLDTHFPKLSRS